MKGFPLILFFFLLPLSLLLLCLIARRRRKKGKGNPSRSFRHRISLQEERKNRVYRRENGYDLLVYYDNEVSYGQVSCKDYLTYRLVYLQREVKEELRRRGGEKKGPGEYSMRVKIFEMDMAGRLLQSKEESFYAPEIRKILERLSDREGAFFKDEGIWESIVRAERGKVSNRMRFAIYKRDGHRCRKCGKRGDDLEIDHIVPIAKGGKSTMGNLQTLCHRCNVEKGTNVERWI